MEIQDIYTVGQVNAYIKNMFRQDKLLQSLFVKGEVSNCRYQNPTGHIYFTLKDAQGTISCVMFARSGRSGLTFRLTEGQQDIVGGYVSIYERDGKYQLYAGKITQAGSGQIHEQLERLKRELEEAGMFAQEYKRPIPKFIKTLGVVTSISERAAAVRDIIVNVRKQNPCVQIIVTSTLVQGDGAPASIVRSIRALERLPVDLMIIGRGGGSREDLWAFNEREVAQAVFDCSVPIISAVGHETDTTITDLIADLRVSTPTAAAKEVTNIREIMGMYVSCWDRLQRPMQRRVEQSRGQARHMGMKLQLVSPGNQIRERRLEAVSTQERLEERMRRILNRRRHALNLYVERMRGLSPLEKLSSGYSYVEDEEGRNLRSVRQVRAGQNILVRMKDGQVRARVTEVPAVEKDRLC